MGIPSYFSYIIKNHGKIVRALAQTGRIQHLFMDCNSIIYDIFHALDGNVDEDQLIQKVIEKIWHYVRYIRPTKTLYVAFDGVAPLAKMDQQRTRRHKTLWTTESDEPTWSTCNITPGTPFMQNLSTQVVQAFASSCLGIETVIVSAADECGEGEHKLFQYVRSRGDVAWTQDHAAVYGLDSDLIMLSLFHCSCFKKLYVFRETPEFIKSQIPCENGDPCHFLDIAHLSTAILKEMKCNDPRAIYDYIFMCFFLGNDFLPHFPALNLRTHGLQVLMHTYRQTFQKGGGLISVDKTIQWPEVQRFVKALAKQEKELWAQEYETRAKWANRKWSTANEKDRDLLLQNVPVVYRAEELYIAPEYPGWESRYYRALVSDADPATVCENYLHGLAWVFRYYTQDCVNWRWRYEYDYPPLLKDLAQCGVFRQGDVISEARGPYSPQVQLAYVIPSVLQEMAGATAGAGSQREPLLQDMARATAGSGHPPVQQKSLGLCPPWPKPKPAFQWAFCRYFWEAHVCLPPTQGHIE